MEVPEYFTWLIWMCLTLTPVMLKNPKLDQIMPSFEALEQLLNASLVVIAPGVLEALRASTPPTVAWFHSLPVIVTNRWAVYVLLLEKPGHRSKAYIGLGTGCKRGVATRWANYDNRLSLPSLVEAALNDGFTITCKRVICHSPIPPRGSRVPLRGLLLLIEATLSIAFWAMESRTKDYGMPHLCSWPLHKIEYDGLCSHSSIYEGIRGDDEGLTPEQIKVKVDAAKRREAEQHKAKYHNFKAVDFEGWQAQRRRYNQNAARNPESAAKKKVILQNFYSKNKATEQFKCTLCDKTFCGRSQLDEHYLSKRHVDKIKGKNRFKKSPIQDAFRARNKAARKFACNPCNFNGGTKQSLNVHRGTKGHIGKVANVAESSDSIT
jgi:hypothetical protein